MNLFLFLGAWWAKWTSTAFPPWRCEGTVSPGKALGWAEFGMALITRANCEKPRKHILFFLPSGRPQCLCSPSPNIWMFLIPEPERNRVLLAMSNNTAQPNGLTKLVNGGTQGVALEKISRDRGTQREQDVVLMIWSFSLGFISIALFFLSRIIFDAHL